MSAPMMMATDGSDPSPFSCRRAGGRQRDVPYGRRRRRNCPLVCEDGTIARRCALALLTMKCVNRDLAPGSLSLSSLSRLWP